MTPQEKAVEILTQYRRHLPSNTVTDLEAKGCALIAVDEILNAFDLAELTGFDGWGRYEWREVKAEIEKL